MLKKTIVDLYEGVAGVYLKPLLRYEQRKRTFRVVNERSTEYAYALDKISTLAVGKILDVGPGRSAWPHLLSNCGFDVRAIDKIRGYWGSFSNRHFSIDRDDITSPKTNERFQFVTCLSVLEHIPEHRKAIQGMHSLLEKDGYLVLSFPYNESTYIGNVYDEEGSGYGRNFKFIAQVYSRKEINTWLSDTSYKIVDQRYYRAFTGEYWTFGDRVAPVQEVSSSDTHQLTCLLLQKQA